MFTVLHRAGDGTETLYSASTVSRAHSGEPSIPPHGGVSLSLDPGTYPFPSGENGAIVTFEPYAATEEMPFQPMVFVMNKQGATVATYRL